MIVIEDKKRGSLLKLLKLYKNYPLCYKNSHLSTICTDFQSSTKVNVYITSNDCLNSGITQGEMESLIKDSFETFWNSVPTSSLELEFKGVKSVDASAADLNSLFNDHVSDNQILVGFSLVSLMAFLKRRKFFTEIINEWADDLPNLGFSG